MERRIHLSCQAQRAQARLSSVRRESLYARRLSRHGRAESGEFAARAGRPHGAAENSQSATEKVSWVRLTVFPFCQRPTRANPRATLF